MRDRHKKQISLTLKLVKIIIVTAVLYGVSLCTPFVDGYSWYPIATLNCGHEPYIADRFAAANTYTKPGDRLYTGPTFFTSKSDFYCTENDVINAGFSPNVWGPERCTSQFGNLHINTVICGHAQPKNVWLNYLPVVIAWLVIVTLFLMNGKWQTVQKTFKHFLKR